ncbi:hypothetical protein, conserved [Trypanosoma brucei gambiense DAL972]|uniref:Uncharacterized protein n=1 Tax=Trypanosoma brucei gambiense (strain MHOM/CI/86/DAL972) TaxID=679716 RepID=D0A3Q9_TRYB9|nr:hypothetical protein, conserved [Trypanosoma brucei gambiense DAL972]CBH15903.1 hypothetical protein, conserved [Trypanosoma brucei gambiense DAL972]|eukprot:XP_011778167.1 hypothetical protein, conserved [Trypanosoma brucei gambiense DAL972]
MVIHLCGLIIVPTVSSLITIIIITLLYYVHYMMCCSCCFFFFCLLVVAHTCLPSLYASYTHRVGRSYIGGMSGWFGSPAPTAAPPPIPLNNPIGVTPQPSVLAVPAPQPVSLSVPKAVPIPQISALQQPLSSVDANLLMPLLSTPPLPLSTLPAVANESRLTAELPPTLSPGRSSEPLTVSLEGCGGVNVAAKAAILPVAALGGSEGQSGEQAAAVVGGAEQISPALGGVVTDGDTLAACRKSLPSYVVFGGARYNRVDVPPGAVKVLKRSNEKLISVSPRNTAKYMSHQLQLASAILRLDSLMRPPSSSFDAAARFSAVAPQDAGPLECDTFSLKNIWTIAYAGSVKDLHAFIELDGSAVSARGFVVYNRRHYGVKRLSEKFVLGLGQKATPLQYAAIAGHVDSVVLLLCMGAEDDSYPYLRDILGDELETTVKGVNAKLRSPRKHHCSRRKGKRGPAPTVAPPPPAAEEDCPAGTQP